MSNEELFMSRGDGIKIKLVRNNMGLSVTEFSERTEINPSYLKLLEKGCLPLSSRDKRKISEVFGLSDDWFETIDTSKYLQPAVSDKEKESIDKSSISEEAEIVAAEKEAPEKEAPEQRINITNGEILKLTRIGIGLSRKEIADAIGITSVQIGYIETGKRTLTEKVKNKLNDYFKTVPIPQNALINDMEILNSALNDKDVASNNLSDGEILNKISLIKKEKGYTQTVISQKTGINRSQLSMIENGKMQISKKIKVKLLNFILSDSEDNKYALENILSKTTQAQSTSLENVNTEQKKINEIISDNIILSKFELIKVLESMKKARDEMINNINILETVLKSCKWEMIHKNP